jgi:hypothetical protein
LYFWRIYEMDFPEGSNVKAPGGSDFPFGAFLFAFLSAKGILLKEKGVIKGKNTIK